MGFWEIFSLGIGVVSTFFGRKINNYFGDQVRGQVRTGKLVLATRIVEGIVDYLAISAAYSENRAEMIKEAVRRATDQLVLNGFDPQKAAGIAEREVGLALARRDPSA